VSRNGFWICGKNESVLGLKASDTASRQAPAAESNASGRQRAEGRRPSGKSSGKNRTTDA
jgi:hypothetical protein